jgi:hypothetical protein
MCHNSPDRHDLDKSNNTTNRLTADRETTGITTRRTAADFHS